MLSRQSSDSVYAKRSSVEDPIDIKGDSNGSVTLRFPDDDECPSYSFGSEDEFDGTFRGLDVVVRRSFIFTISMFTSTCQPTNSSTDHRSIEDFDSELVTQTLPEERSWDFANSEDESTGAAPQPNAMVCGHFVPVSLDAQRRHDSRTILPRLDRWV